MRCPCVGGKRDAPRTYGRRRPEGLRPEIRVAIRALPSIIPRLNGDKDSMLLLLILPSSSFRLIVMSKVMR